MIIINESVVVKLSVLLEKALTTEDINKINKTIYESLKNME